MNFWEFFDKNPGWTILALLVGAYCVEQTAKALRKPKTKPKRN
jgi:hypothetical protein